MKDGTATMKGSGPSQGGRSRSRAERRPGLGTKGGFRRGTRGRGGGGDASASDETCEDCVMASRLLAIELRANSTISFVVGEVDALCAALGAELAHQCDAVVEPYVPVLLDELASSLKNVCARLGVCPK